MHAHDQDIFIVRAVKDSDCAPARNRIVNAPQKIVRELLGRGRLESRNEAALRVHSGGMPDGAVFAARVECLQESEQTVALIGIKQMLKFAQAVQHPLVGVVVALFPERVVGVAISQARLAAWLDDAMFGEVHAF